MTKVILVVLEVTNHRDDMTKGCFTLVRIWVFGQKLWSKILTQIVTMVKYMYICQTRMYQLCYYLDFSLAKEATVFNFVLDT